MKIIQFNQLNQKNVVWKFIDFNAKININQLVITFNQLNQKNVWKFIDFNSKT